VGGGTKNRESKNKRQGENMIRRGTEEALRLGARKNKQIKGAGLKREGGIAFSIKDGQ